MFIRGERYQIYEIPHIKELLEHHNDELDHLGMYSDTFERDDECQTIAYGYRENVDEYFSSLVNKGLKIDKPKQKMPVKFEEIITCLDKTSLKERVRLAIFLLDFSSDAKNDEFRIELHLFYNECE